MQLPHWKPLESLISLHFSFFIFILFCMHECFACMCLYVTCSNVWCPWRPKEGIRSHGTVGIDASKPPPHGNWETLGLTTKTPVSLPHLNFFFMKMFKQDRIVSLHYNLTPNILSFIIQLSLYPHVVFFILCLCFLFFGVFLRESGSWKANQWFHVISPLNTLVPIIKISRLIHHFEISWNLASI